MRASIAMAALIAAAGACGRTAPVADDPPAATSGGVAVAPAAVSAVLVYAPVGSAAASASASADPAPVPGAVPPRIKEFPPVLSAPGLPDAVVRRIVRQNVGRMRLCYENAALADPELAGSVAVLYRIDASGAVSSVKDAGSTVSSPDLVACVIRVFQGLSFPSPSPAPVDVSETIYFSPASDP